MRRIDGASIQLLTRSGLDWSHRYGGTIEALGSLRVKTAYLDGERSAPSTVMASRYSAGSRRRWTKAAQISSSPSPRASAAALSCGELRLT